VRRPQCLHGELRQRIEPASLVELREDEQHSSRPYHPPNLSEVAEQVGPVVVGLDRRDEIKPIIGERQLGHGRVPDVDSAGGDEARIPLARCRNAAVGVVDGTDQAVRCLRSELFNGTASATPDTSRIVNRGPISM
jgi:hypothetical protein